MNMPSAQEIARRFVTFTPQKAPRYEEGVRNPANDWAKNTIDAGANYNAGVQAAIARKGFEKGVQKAGTGKQQGRSITKGIPRWSEGVAGSEADMAAAMTPVVAVMSAIKLPPKFAKGDPRNYERTKAIGMELRKAKVEGRI